MDSETGGKSKRRYFDTYILSICNIMGTAW